MGKEMELKLAIDSLATKERLINSKELFNQEYETVNLEAIYYDTPEFILGENRVGLRTRRENDTMVATLKYGGSEKDGLHTRGEINHNISCMDMDLEYFPEKALEIKAMIGNRKLEPVVTTKITRLKKVIFYRGAQLELALDYGQVLANEKYTDILELEVELLEGESKILHKFAKEVLAEFRLKPEKMSKLAKGFQLYSQS